MRGWRSLTWESVKTLAMILFLIALVAVGIWIMAVNWEECRENHSVGYCLRHEGHG